MTSLATLPGPSAPRRDSPRSLRCSSSAGAGTFSNGVLMQNRRVLPILVLIAGLSVSCATLTPGSDPVVVRAQDVLVDSLAVYDSAMRLHYQVSTQEPPAVYAALERVRPVFPKAWRGLNASLEAYKAAKIKDPVKLSGAVLAFLSEVESLGPDSWKASIALIRRAFEGGAR